jgi:NAD(P)-dependent dehydrogenase (short-subunit alcohol dehydrogenase family)
MASAFCTGGLESRYVVLTGGTDGIGRAVLLNLLHLGATAIVVGRSRLKWGETYKLIPAALHNKVEFWCYDLSLMQDVKALADKILTGERRIDTLIHCAGLTLRTKTMTAEGLETVFAVQYLARFYLSNLLLPHLEATNGTVVVVSAGGTISTTAFNFGNLQGEQYYNGVHALKHESVANDMYILDVGKRYPQVNWYNYGPGVVRTGLLRDMGLTFRVVAAVVGYCISVRPEKAADDIIVLISSKPASGLYVRGPKLNKVSSFRSDPSNQNQLREVSEGLVAKSVKSL